MALHEALRFSGRDKGAITSGQSSYLALRCYTVTHPVKFLIYFVYANFHGLVVNMLHSIVLACYNQYTKLHWLNH